MSFELAVVPLHPTSTIVGLLRHNLSGYKDDPRFAFTHVGVGAWEFPDRSRRASITVFFARVLMVATSPVRFDVMSDRVPETMRVVVWDGLPAGSESWETISRGTGWRCIFTTVAVGEGIRRGEEFHITGGPASSVDRFGETVFLGPDGFVASVGRAICLPGAERHGRDSPAATRALALVVDWFMQGVAVKTFRRRGWSPRLSDQLHGPEV
jgi:hypothetical protein